MTMLHEVEVTFKLHPDVRSLHEEWSGVGNPQARRKLQNRLNQRALRRRKLAEKQQKQDSSIEGRDPQNVDSISDCWPSGFISTPTSSESCNFRKDISKRHRMICANDYLFANFDQVVNEYVERDMAYRLPADHLLSLIYYNVFRAFALNIQRLDLSVDGMCLDEYQSKFPSMPLDDPSLALLPPGLRPTELQRSIPHHPMWDVFPDPVLRDNILLYGEDNFDDVELCSQIFGDGDTAPHTDTYNATGLIAWGPDPGLTCAWEVTKRFAQNWPWFLKGAIELQNATNAWRRRRGESPIVFEVR